MRLFRSAALALVLTTWLVSDRTELLPIEAQAQTSERMRVAGIDLRLYVERFTGPEPTDCGQHVLVGPTFVTAGAEQLQRSVSCGLDAAKGQKPFWMFKQEQGIDSLVFEGLLGRADGTTFRFSYDSAPCGGAGCPGRFSIERCELPRVTNRGSGAGVGCQR